MAYLFSRDDVAYLESPAGSAMLRQAAELRWSSASYLADLTRLRKRAGDRAGVIAETVRLRRRAVRRWGTGHPYGEWLVTDEALQQASPPPVAAHRARRIGTALGSLGCRGVHDVTCSIGADLVALASAGVVAIGSDLDPVRLAMARHNLAASGVPARLACADARIATSRGLLRYADPARRDTAGRRISSVDTVPSVAALDAADPSHPPVLRLPPGIDFPRLGRPGEIEIVSWRGAVREAVSWPPALAEAGRRATVLGDNGPRETLTDADAAEESVTGPDRYVIEPDPAVIRAHLVGQYAARHGLTLLDPHLAYLTGSEVPHGIRAFEVLAVAPFSEKTVRRWVRDDDVGTLEIKQRGTPIVPDRLRKRLRPAGDTRKTRTLVIARLGTRQRALWCRAIPATAS